MRGFNHIKLGSVKSTNSFAENLLAEKRVDRNTLIQADFQTGGKGQGENKWFSDERKNILISYIIFPDSLTIGNYFILNQVCSLSIVNVISRICKDHKPVIKWPNDILVDRKKISGLLIQNNIEGELIRNTIIGIGINVNQMKFPEFYPPATSMIELTGDNFRTEAIISMLSEELLDYFSKIKKKQFETIREEYFNHLFLLNTKSKFKDSKSNEFVAEIIDIDEDGRIVLRKENRIEKYYFKEITFLY